MKTTILLLTLVNSLNLKLIILYYIGYDLGSSSVKVAIVDANTGQNIISLNEPSNEMEIFASQINWAEQDPNMWWDYICIATKRAIKESNIYASKI